MELLPSNDTHVVGLARVGERIVVSQGDTLLGEECKVGWDLLGILNEIDTERVTYDQQRPCRNRCSQTTVYVSVRIFQYRNIIHIGRSYAPIHPHTVISRDL